MSSICFSSSRNGFSPSQFLPLFNKGASDWIVLTESEKETFWESPPPPGMVRLHGELKFVSVDQTANLANQEHLWVISELAMVDIELMLFWSGDMARQKFTEAKWNSYAVELRNYTTIIDGQLVITADSRPQKPL